jgi:hypothetical protein
MGVLPGHAMAATHHQLIFSFGPGGTAGSAFPDFKGDPIPPPPSPNYGANNALAFDQASKQLWVAVARHVIPPASSPDEGEICLFDAYDEIEGKATPGSCMGDFALGNLPSSGNASLAVDNTTGPLSHSIYLIGHREPPDPLRLHGIDPNGDELLLTGSLKALPDPFAVAVDSTGHIWVADQNRKAVVELIPSTDGATIAEGRFVDISNVSSGRPRRIGFDSANNLYVTFYMEALGPALSPGVYKLDAGSNYTEVSRIDEGDELPVKTITVDSRHDRLFVVHKTSIHECDVSGIDPECGKSFAEGGDLASVFAGGISDANYEGIAIDEDEDREKSKVYLSDAGNAQIHVFDTSITEPSAVALPATDRTSSSATAAGTVNPKGKALSACNFEFVTEDEFQQTGFDEAEAVPCSPPAASIPVNEVPNAVSASLTDLDPATRHRYRIVATSSEGTGASTSQLFATLGPLISQTKALAVTFSEAILATEINPQGKTTAYRFEYVDSKRCQEDLAAKGPGHCFDRAEVSPSPDSQIVASEADQSVSVALSDLVEGTKYHFQVVATNEDAAEISSPEMTFSTHIRDEPDACPNATGRTGASKDLPECRVYEQVSPVIKGTAEAAELKAQASADGDSLAFPAQALQVFPGSAGGPSWNPYLSTRRGDGLWLTRNLATAFEPRGFGNIQYRYLGFAEDLSRMVFCSDASLGVPGDGSGLYLRDNVGNSYEEVAETTGKVGGTCGFIFNGEGMIADPGYEHVVFETTERLCGAPNVLGGGPIVYEWRVHEWGKGTCAIVSRLPGSNAVISGSVKGRAGAAAFGYGDHAVSVDGSRVLWNGTGADGVSTLYARVGGTETIDLGLSERTPPDPAGPQAKAFVEASADGSKVFFASAEKLTDDSTATTIGGSFGNAITVGDLYRYDFDAAVGERLIDVTANPDEPEPATPKGARVQGAIGASADGNRIYFVALGALADGAVAGEPNLYLWDHNNGTPVTTHIATLVGSGVDKDNVAARHGLATPMTNPSGDRVIFVSTARLSAYDNANRPMVYLYDASEDELRCLSCDPSGEPASADASLGEGIVSAASANLYNHQRRNLSTDGSRVFFETADSLLPGDINGHIDVYLWHGGKLNLISTGDSGTDSRFVDASATGDDIFFTTRDQLSPLDADSQIDIYDARVNGIAAESPPPVDDCQGEACQPAATAPDDPTPASSGFVGPVSKPSPGPNSCPKRKRKVRRKGKVRCIKPKPRSKHKQRRANGTRRAKR